MATLRSKFTTTEVLFYAFALPCEALVQIATAIRIFNVLYVQCLQAQVCGFI